MTIRSILLYFLFLFNPVFAQNREGVIIDATMSIYDCVVINRKSQQHTFSNSDGYFQIKAGIFDTLIFIKEGFYPNFKVVKAVDLMKKDTILLQQRIKELKTVRKYSAYAQFQKDSIENRVLYHKQIADAQRKVKVRLDNGIMFDGIFSGIADKISGNKKKNKKLLKTIEQDDKDKYIALYYNIERVKTIAHTSDSIASVFISAYPMPYDFARKAGSLEKDIWIKEQFQFFQRKYLAH